MTNKNNVFTESKFPHRALFYVIVFIFLSINTNILAGELPDRDDNVVPTERQSIIAERPMVLPSEKPVKKYRIWMNFNLMVGGLSHYDFNGLKSDAIFVSNLKVGLRLAYMPWKGQTGDKGGFWQRGLAMDIFYSSMNYKTQANSGTYLLSQQMHLGLLFMGIYKDFYIGGGGFVNFDLGQTAYNHGTEIPVASFRMELKNKTQFGLSFVLGYMTHVFGKTITAYVGGRFEMSLNKTINEYTMDTANSLLRTGLKQSSSQFSMLLEFGFGY